MDFFQTKGGKGPQPGAEGLFLNPNNLTPEATPAAAQQRSGRGLPGAEDIEDVVPRAVSPAAEGRRVFDMGSEDAPAPAAAHASTPEPTAAPAIEAVAPPAQELPPTADIRQDPVFEQAPDAPLESSQRFRAAEQAPEQAPATSPSAAQAPGLKMRFNKGAGATGGESGNTSKPNAFSAFASMGKGKKQGEPKATVLGGPKSENQLVKRVKDLLAKKPKVKTDEAGKASPAKPVKEKGAKKPFKWPQFKLKKTIPAAAAEQQAAQEGPTKAPAAAKKGLLDFLKAGRKKAAAGEAVPKPDQKAKKGFKAPKAGRKKKDAPSPVQAQYILVQLRNEQDMVWKVTGTGLEEVSDALGAQKLPPFASFTPQDVRIFVDMPQSASRARELALQALEEAPRVINLSKQANAIYATGAERLGPLKTQRVGPGLPLLEALLKPHFEELKGKMTERDVISGFMLADEATKRVLVILYHFTKNGDVQGPEVVADPSDVSLTLRQFAAKRKVDPAQADIMLYRNTELLNGGLPPYLYPNDAVVLGMPLAQAVAGAALVSTVAAVGCLAFAGQAYVKQQILKKQAQDLRNHASVQEGKLKELIGGSVASFATHQMLPVDDFVKQAAGFWVTGARVSMEATALQQRYVVQLNMTPRSNNTAAPSILDEVRPVEVMALTNVEVPEHCTKQSPSVTGTLDAIQLIINCETTPGPLRRYSLD